MVHRFILACVVLFGLQGVLAAGTESDISDVLNEFRQRIELLEARDAEIDVKIADLESEISELKSKMVNLEFTHRQKEATLQDKIAILEETLDQSSYKGQQSGLQSERVSPKLDLQAPAPSSIKRRESYVRRDRAVSETNVAFYATHSEAIAKQLQGDNFPFQQAITNNGNAYNNDTGAFVAPVAGTYVFHATLMGYASNYTQKYLYRAVFDVDGTPYSMLSVDHIEQSSQMLVINLTAGQRVAVRNDYEDCEFIGIHLSTFSGFLLHQDKPTDVIVGK